MAMWNIVARCDDGTPFVIAGGIVRVTGIEEYFDAVDTLEAGEAAFVDEETKAPLPMPMNAVYRAAVALIGKHIEEVEPVLPTFSEAVDKVLADSSWSRLP